MACTHKGPVEIIRRADGTPGVRCPKCGMTAFKGDRLLRTLWNDVKRWLKR